jgi:hypothetical protein
MVQRAAESAELQIKFLNHGHVVVGGDVVVKLN